MSANRSKKKISAGNDRQDLRSVEIAASTARGHLEAMLAWVESQATGALDLHDVERSVFERLLVLGRLLLQAHLAKRGTGRAAAVQVGTGKRVTTLPYHCEKKVTYYSIFGKLRIARSYFWSWGKGMEGETPLDQELNLPARQYSYVVQELATLLGAQGPFDRVCEIFERVFGVRLWKHSVESITRDAGADVQRFYEQAPAPTPHSEGEILAVAIDGKGVPMLKTEPAPPQPRRYAGDKANKKKMAVVSAIYTVHPHWRTAEEVAASLFRERDRSNAEARVDRVAPLNKRVRATLEGVDASLHEVMRIVAQRDPRKTKIRVALVDGERRLVDRPEFENWIQVLDLFHALERLWEAGTALHGEGSRETELWVRARLVEMLSGKVPRVIKRIREEVARADLSWGRRDKLETITRYYEKNLDRMRYGEFLRQGLPIGTGVVEGACGSLVNDRADRSGMRWTPVGATAVLELRAVEQNGDWNAFWAWRIEQERARIYPDRLKRVVA